MWLEKYTTSWPLARLKLGFVLKHVLWGPTRRSSQELRKKIWKNIFFLVWNFFLPFKFSVCLVIQILKDHISLILQPKKSIFYIYVGVHTKWSFILDMKNWQYIAYQPISASKEDRQNFDWIWKKFLIFKIMTSCMEVCCLFN